MRLEVVVLFACAASVLGSALEDSWQNYKRNFSKVYSHGEEEETSRRRAFEENLLKVEEHNRKADAGLFSFRLAINKFADLTNEEYRNLVLRPLPTVRTANNNGNGTARTRRSAGPDPPDSFDWRDSGFVGPVRDQGEMGNAVVLATVDAVQSSERYYLRSLVPLSTQQLVECCGTDPCTSPIRDVGDYCKCLMDMGGLDSEATYPSRECQQCSFDSKDVLVPIFGYYGPAGGYEDGIKFQLPRTGLGITTVDASNMSFQLYSSGIYDEPNCSSTELNHVMVIVGYGTENDKDFWIVKNSWGTGWGEGGYIRMSRNKNNQCGITTQVWFPLSRP